MNDSILQKLRDDHRRVLELLDAWEPVMLDPRTPESLRHERVHDLVERLEEQFDSHMAAEDEVLLPALARRLQDGDSLVAPLHEEHAELRAMVAALSATLASAPWPDREEQIGVQVRDLADLLRIHIRREETLVFTIAERLLGPREFEDLAARRSPPPAA